MSSNPLSKITGGMSPDQKKLLSKIKDPQQRALQQLQIDQQNQSLIATTISNIMQMKHDEAMTPVRNLKD